MSERTNAAWVETLRAQEPAALADLGRHLERAARFAIRRRLAAAPGVASDELDALAEDSAQEALLLVLKNLGGYRGEARFLTWASAIAVGVALGALRRRLWRDLSLDRMPDGWREPASAATGGGGWEHPDLAAQRAEIWSAIREVVARDLTERQRRFFSLVVIDGVDAEEVAERLGTSPGALYKLTHDARRKLKAGLVARGFATGEILAAFSPGR
jgi:RNA polymerase sigma-70 factor, ECF subfamily